MWVATANAIEKAIDPDYEHKQSLRLPKRLLDRAKIQARLKGITVEEYLDELMNGDAEDSRPAEPEVASQFTPEMSQIINEVELQWLEPSSDRITLEIILALVHKYAAIAKLTFFAQILTSDRPSE